MKPTTLIVSTVIVLGGIGAVYGWADQMNFKLDKPTWQSEASEPHEIAYRIAGNYSFNDYQTAVNRQAKLNAQIKDMHAKKIPVPLDLINMRNYWARQARDKHKEVQRYQREELKSRSLR